SLPTTGDPAARCGRSAICSRTRSGATPAPCATSSRGYTRFTDGAAGPHRCDLAARDRGPAPALPRAPQLADLCPPTMERLGLVSAALAASALAACVEPAGPAETIDEQLAVVCGDGPTVKGIDVSYYETSIDWPAVHDAGIEFAFIRVSDGLQFM